jgi:hypothetical protein
MVPHAQDYPKREETPLLIVAERINSTRKRISAAIRERNADFIRREALMQVEAGGNFIDVNAGASVAHEVEDLVWLTRTVQSAVDSPVCLDSANAEALAVAEDAKLRTSADLLLKMSAKLDLCENESQVKAVGKEISPELKKKMTATDLADLRAKYQDADKRVKGIA